MNDWQEWTFSNTMKACGNSTRARTIKKEGKHGGDPCEKELKTETGYKPCPGK